MGEPSASSQLRYVWRKQWLLTWAIPKRLHVVVSVFQTSWIFPVSIAIPVKRLGGEGKEMVPETPPYVKTC